MSDWFTQVSEVGDVDKEGACRDTDVRVGPDGLLCVQSSPEMVDSLHDGKHNGFEVGRPADLGGVGKSKFVLKGTTLWPEGGVRDAKEGPW